MNNDFTEIVGAQCFTSSKWARLCNATRVDFAGFRFYKHDVPEGVNPYRKGATFLSDTITSITREDKFLVSWRKGKEKELGGAEQFDKFMQSMADFGTSGHILYDRMVQGIATEESLVASIKAFALEHNLSKVTEFKAIETAKKNLLAFRAFNAEHEIEVFACEQMVTSATLGISTPVDILATGMFQIEKSGKKKKCWLLGNLKTSENAQNHSYQCAIELYCAWQSIVPQMLAIEDLPIVVGTIRPKDWRTEPTFEFKDYTAFAIEENTTTTLEQVAGILQKNNLMVPPDIKTITWEGPLLPDTKFDYIPLF
jgi:hypothetical protein